MRVSFYVPFTVSATLIAGSAALIDPQLTGTWSTKSNKVFTGPAFYDPVNEKFTEPSLTGISYSFTNDGFYEEAYYRAISNPTRPSCPEGLMQFQHGTYTKSENGSLILEPFAVDGRQLESNPCKSKTAVYTRYNQSEVFKSYQILTDPYHNILRLNLFKFDGTPMNPMYLAFNPPQMLPTITLNPTATAKPTGNAKRGQYEMPVKPMNHRVMKRKKDTAGADRLWWIGVAMTLIGALGYLCFD